MAKKYDYTVELKLKHNETAAIIDCESGLLTEHKPKKSKVPKGKELWLKDDSFYKAFDGGNEVIDWIEHEGLLTDLELRVLWKWCRSAKYETNSLEPLNDDYAIKNIADEFRIGRNKVTPMLKKFYDLGIYGTFDVKRYNVPYTKYWLLNPYLCIRGKMIDSDIAKLFEGTIIHLKYCEFKEKTARLKNIDAR